MEVHLPSITEQTAAWEKRSGFKIGGGEEDVPVRAGRIHLGEHDAVEWEVSKEDAAYRVVLNYFTFNEAWDSAYDRRFPSVKQAVAFALKEAKIAVRAMRESQGRDSNGWASAEEVAEVVNVGRHEPMPVF